MTTTNDSLVRGLSVARVDIFNLNTQIKSLEDTVVKKETKINSLLKALEQTQVSRRNFLSDQKASQLCLAYLVSYSCFFVFDYKLKIFFSPRKKTNLPEKIGNFVLKLQDSVHKKYVQREKERVEKEEEEEGEDQHQKD